MQNLTELLENETSDNLMLDASLGSFLLERARLTEDEQRHTYLEDAFNILATVREASDNVRDEIGAENHNSFRKTLLNCFNEYVHLFMNNDKAKNYDTEFGKTIQFADGRTVNDYDAVTKLHIASRLRVPITWSGTSRGSPEFYIDDAIGLIGEVKPYLQEIEDKEWKGTLTTSMERIIWNYVKQLDSCAVSKMTEVPDVEELMESVKWASYIADFSVLTDEGPSKLEIAGKAVDLRVQIGNLVRDGSKYTDRKMKFEEFREQYNLLQHRSEYALDQARNIGVSPTQSFK